MTTTMRQALEALREQLRQELIYLNCIELSDIGLESLHCKTQFAKEIDAILAIPSPERDQLEHGRNCPARVRNASDDCTCGLVWRTQIQTEQEMHQAWRKRAEEAEAKITNPSPDLDAVAEECIGALYHYNMSRTKRVAAVRAVLSRHFAPERDTDEQR